MQVHLRICITYIFHLCCISHADILPTDQVHATSLPFFCLALIAMSETEKPALLRVSTFGDSFFLLFFYFLFLFVFFFVFHSTALMILFHSSFPWNLEASIHGLSIPGFFFFFSFFFWALFLYQESCFVTHNTQWQQAVHLLIVSALGGFLFFFFFLFSLLTPDAFFFFFCSALL